MALAAPKGRIFVATVAFNCDPWGWVYVGDTVREGHPMLEGREQFFKVRKDSAKFEFVPKASPTRTTTTKK
jgi:hypothetical protein